MEVAVELEDDLFFADLSKEIALLIMDEEEDPLDSCPPHSLQVPTFISSNFKHMHHAYFFSLLLPNLFVCCNNLNMVELIFRLFPGQFILLHSLLFSMSML